MVKTLASLNKRIPPGYPLLGKLNMCCVGARASGKTYFVVEMIKKYAKIVNLIVALSPTINLDKNWVDVKKLPNFLFSETVNNETLSAIIEAQKERFQN